MTKKYLRLNEDDELIIFNPKNGCNCIKFCNDKVEITEVEPKTLPNMEITSLSYDDLKSFVLFDDYYQNLNYSIKDFPYKEINTILDAHFSTLYGPLYNKDNADIEETIYQAITTFKTDKTN